LDKNVRRRGEQTGGSFDSFFKEGVTRYSPPRGDNAVRFLPPTWEDAEHYGHDIWVHYGIGADKGSYLCLKKMKDKPCPICDAANEMKAEGGKEAEAGKRISAKQRVLTYVIDRNERRPKLAVWAMPWTVDKDVSLASQNKKTGEVLNIVNAKKGYDVFFRLEGQKLNTKYSGVSIDRDPSPLSDDKREAEEWLAEAEERPLPKLLKFYDADYLQEVVDGHSAASTDDDDDDDAPRSKRKRRDSDDDDDEEDEGPRNRRSSRNSDDDDDDGPAPRRRGRDRDSDDDDEEDAPRGKRKRPADDDDDDEPAPRKRKRASDDDDDEDDAPSRKKRKRSDDEDEADPADDDDDADDRPRKKRSRSSDEDDDEDERPRKRARDSDDDDDDDEPAPRRRRR
jgi:hypothetical protein